MEKATAKRSRSHNHATKKRKMKTPNTKTTTYVCVNETHTKDFKYEVVVISSRFAYVIAFLLLLPGAALNDQRGEESVYFGTYFVVKPGVFAGGAILFLASVVFGTVYYITLMEGKNARTPFGDSLYPNQGTIAMGQPQIPTQTRSYSSHD